MAKTVEVERMVSDAQQHADEDRLRREEVEARNQRRFDCLSSRTAASGSGQQCADE